MRGCVEETNGGEGEQDLSGGLLGEAELLLEGLGHLGGRRTGQTEVDLHRVIDEPLKSCQSTDHDDTGDQTLPHT